MDYEEEQILMVRFCRECKIEKEIMYFRAHTRVCKKCRNKKYNEKNSTKNKEFMKDYYVKHRDELIQLAKDRYYRLKEQPTN